MCGGIATPSETAAVGALPFVACMVLAFFLRCLFPDLATWLPTAVMGPRI